MLEEIQWTRPMRTWVLWKAALMLEDRRRPGPDETIPGHANSRSVF